MSVNPNRNQKYEAIFGMKFLIDNGINFINSKREIQWQGVSISILDEPQFDNGRASNLQTKELKDNEYKQKHYEKLFWWNIPYSLRGVEKTIFFFRPYMTFLE